jgi:hypothetical protein
MKAKRNDLKELHEEMFYNNPYKDITAADMKASQRDLEELQEEMFYNWIRMVAIEIKMKTLNNKYVNSPLREEYVLEQSKIAFASRYPFVKPAKDGVPVTYICDHTYEQAVRLLEEKALMFVKFAPSDKKHQEATTKFKAYMRQAKIFDSMKERK